MFCFSALVKLLNKSIEGTADDDEEGVTPDTAIRSGLELLKVHGKDTARRFQVCKSIFILQSVHNLYKHVQKRCCSLTLSSFKIRLFNSG